MSKNVVKIILIAADARNKSLATLYSLDRKPHLNPQPNDRGLQITNEFYNLVKEWLK